MVTDKIERFDGEYSFLSNFHPSPVTYADVEYPTVEHAYQAAKTLDFGERVGIRMAATPGKAKRMGRKATLREDWDDVKVRVMRVLLRKKFRDAELRKKLNATKGKKLVEGNTWGDTFWGVCNGVGENQLGRLLMEVRDGKFGY